jgi:hypothetical protein
MSNQTHARRRSKVRAFIIAEAVAITILVLAGTALLSAGPGNPTLITALNVVMFAAAAGVAAIPIFFFAFAPILPRSGR